MSRPGGNAGLLSDQQVDIIATRLAERLSAPPAAQSNVPMANVTTAKITAVRSALPIAPRERIWRRGFCHGGRCRRGGRRRLP